jgi:putative cell wall-binding protein
MILKKIVSLFGLTMILSSSTVMAQSSSHELTQKRIFGNDRYETSSVISKDGWQNSSNAIICSGEDFPDALCAAPLAKKYNAPVLLVRKNSVSSNVMQELKRLSPEKVTIIGKEGAVSSQVEKDIKKNVSSIKTVERIGGQDRYQTSRYIADKFEKGSEVALVSGKVPSDALTMSSIAASKNMPILLADQNENNIKDYINKNNIGKAYIIGGTSCVPGNMDKITSNSERIYGKDRYESNEKVIERFKDDINFSKIYLTVAKYNGVDQFADALCAAPLAAKESNPIVFGENISSKLVDTIKDKVSDNSSIVAIGGEKLVSKSVVDSLANVDKKDSGNSGGSSSSGGSSHHNNQNYYTASSSLSFPGALTYDVKVTSNKSSEILKGYKLLYDGKVIAQDEDNDGTVRVLSIFFDQKVDKSKFQIQKDNNISNLVF